jgi:predicted nucleic acid-binding protein
MNLGGKIFIDTAVIIYYIEGNQNYAKSTQLIFDLIDEGKAIMVTSTTVFSECLVLPFKNQQYDLADKFDILLKSEPVILADISLKVALTAAELRACNPALKLPDAQNLAVAIQEKCNSFITNDEKLKKISGLDQLSVIILSEIESYLDNV